MSMMMWGMGGRRVDQVQQDGLQEGKILVSRCAKCSIIHNPPRAMCPNCHALEWNWEECSGLGHVHTWVVPRHGVPEGETHIVCIVELEEGPRFMSGVRGIELADMRDELPVEAYFEDDEQLGKYLVFRPTTKTPKQAKPVNRDFHPVPKSRSQRPKEVQWERAAVSGIGQTEFSKDSGRTVISLASEACLAAIEDAGLTPADIDGMVTFTGDANQESALMDNLGVPELTWTGRSNGGGMASVPVMQMSAMAVLTGAATNVLIYRAFNERSEMRFGQPMRPPPGAPAGAARGGPAGLRPPAAMFLNTPAAMYALWYQRYMSVYGVTNEDLGRYTVVARKHAATNPNAWFYNRPITLDDHQNSRWIVEPVLRLLDCCQESDGGVAMVITTTERAKDGPNPPAKFLSLAQGWQKAANAGLGYQEGDLSRFPDCRVAGRQTFRDAGLTPDDIDVLMIYENFTPLVFLTLEELGFCGPGEAKDFIRDGNIELGGKLPLNTHGGLLGEAYIHGVNNNLEAVRQIRGTAANQVQGAEHVMVSNGVGGAIFGKA